MANYLITGAGGGMGSALCRLLTEKGDRVWGIDRVSGEEAGGWPVIPADVTDSESLRLAFERVGVEARRLDGIVHMAGVYDLNSLVEMPEEDFLRDFNVNLFGAFRVNQLFLPLLRENGRIVIVSSELAPLSPLPFTGVYAVTKTALDHYAAALRMELQLLGHPVIVLRPGAVRTNMLPASTEKLDRFCAGTKLYSFSAGRFRRIVGSVESRSVPPERIADLARRTLTVKRPKPIYHVNRNPLLLLYGALPLRLQLWAIRKVLEPSRRYEP